MRLYCTMVSLDPLVSDARAETFVQWSSLAARVLESPRPVARMVEFLLNRADSEMVSGAPMRAPKSAMGLYEALAPRDANRLPMP